MRERIISAMIIGVLIVSAISLYLNFKIWSSIGIGKRTDINTCKKVCNIVYNSSEYLVDSIGSCWCKTRTSFYLNGRIISLEIWRNSGVIENVEESRVVFVNVTG